MKWLLKSPFLRRWSRHRHKRIRGIGSQAAPRRGAKSRRLALASKARSFPFLTRVSQWTKPFRLIFQRSQISRQRSAVWQAIGPLLVTTVTSSSVLGAIQGASGTFLGGAIRGLLESFSVHCRRTVSQDLLLVSSLSVLAFLCLWSPAHFGSSLCLSCFQGPQSVLVLPLFLARCDDSSSLGSLADKFLRHSCWRGVQPRPHYVKLSSSFRWSDNTTTSISRSGS